MVADEKPRESLLGDTEMVELSLLLPGRQVDALEQVAADAGLTIGQFLRRLVNNSITRHQAAHRDPPLFPDRH